MSTELAIIQRGLIPQTVAEAKSMADTLSKASCAPDAYKGKAADTFLAVALGLELGLTPAVSLQSIYVVKGKPSMSASAMVALVLSSCKAKYFDRIKSDGQIAVYETQRIGSPNKQTYSFSQEDAAKAGLGGGMYGKYPKQMLEARAKSYLARDVYPDVLHGIASVEEAQEYEPIEPTPEFKAPDEVIDAEFEDTDSLIDQLLGTKTLKELSALLPQLSSMPDNAEKEMARKIYAEHKKELAGAK